MYLWKQYFNFANKKTNNLHTGALTKTVHLEINTTHGCDGVLVHIRSENVMSNRAMLFFFLEIYYNSNKTFWNNREAVPVRGLTYILWEGDRMKNGVKLETLTGLKRHERWSPVGVGKKNGPLLNTTLSIFSLSVWVQTKRPRCHLLWALTAARECNSQCACPSLNLKMLKWMALRILPV